MSDTRASKPPLALPYYGAPFPDALFRFFRKYATFSGRASRAEYWWAMLVVFALPVIVRFFVWAATGEWPRIDDGPFAWAPEAVRQLFGLLIFIPSLAVTWRRLHDSDHSGAWFFIVFIPVLGWIWLLVLLIAGPRPAGAARDGSYRVGRPV